MKSNNLDLQSIHPCNGVAFSPNLHRFMAARQRRVSARFLHVYKDSEGTLWLGFLDEGMLIGAQLMRVLCLGAKTETYCFTHLGALAKVTDFWPRYQAVGRCAIDPDHKIAFIDDDTRWSREMDQRSCVWCSQCQQRLDRCIEPVRREAWRPVSLSIEPSVVALSE